jgi:thioredoxin-related protein
MKTRSLLTFVAVLGAFLAADAATSTPRGFTDDLDAAMKRAATSGRKIVTVFSGSDWCGWCKRLEKEVFSQDAFLKEATNAYELVYIDNPADQKVLSETGRKNNRRLTEKYGIKGFPTVLVLDAEGKSVAKFGYEPGGPEKYLAMLDAQLRSAPDIEKYIKPIEAVLNRYDKDMQADMEAAVKEVEKNHPEPAKSASKEERSKYVRTLQDAMAAVVFGRIADKYIPLYDKAFAEARAMKVPARLETRKAELIDEQAERFGSFKAERDDYRRQKASGSAEPGRESSR